jgi:hypothetical protein
MNGPIRSSIVTLISVILAGIKLLYDIYKDAQQEAAKREADKREKDQQLPPAP